MTFNDIFKSSFLENMTSVTLLDMVLALSLAFAVGLFIFMIYKKTYAGVMYSSNFGVTLIALTMISTLVILAITANVVLSLGMVGALSIVRFRTAIKDPLDIAFLFWSIAAGIVLAAGMVPLAVFGSAFLGVMFLIFVNKSTHESPYMLVITCTDYESECYVQEFLKKYTKKMVIKSKTVSPNQVELNLEIRLRTPDTNFVNALADYAGIQHIALVSFNGEYMG